MLFEGNLLKLSATLDSAVPSGRVNENLSHEARSHANEMRAALPAQILIASKFDVRLVDERRWLERVTRPFAAEIVSGQPAQLLHHQGH
jgi:hypothetical protein